MRVFAALLVVALLAGCDRDEPQRESSSPPLKPEVLTDSAPALEPPAPVVPQPQPQSHQEPPAIKIESVAEPEAPVEPKLTVKVSPPAPRKAHTAPPEESLPPLDLSLPDDWVEALEEGEPTESALLPPLFAAPEPEPSVHVSGRLIPWVDKDETVIDGAQLDFEFRR